jgi:hypothetical protein
MKIISIILGTALAFLMLGCASAPVALMPTGPNPNGTRSMVSEGGLQVFSFMEPESDDQNQGSSDPLWHQHTDYNVYSQNGKLFKHVENTVGHYAETPRVVTLPAGHYFVKARAVGYLLVRVPVTIKSGQITRLHLDERWNPPVGIVKTAFVSLPDGKPIGWRNDAGK